MGPLKGMKVVEFGGIGPGPLCAQMLADMGADIIRIDRRGDKRTGINPKYNVLHRSRRSIALDLKKPEGREVALRLIEQSEALIEGFRPGVMERIGLGPDVCMERNPKIIYGRITGWGQEGPISLTAGHDINYISLAGVLHAIGYAGERPLPPLNLVGDFGGGGMLLAFGIMCGVYEAQKSGKGQVVDAAMVDGAAILAGQFFGLWAAGQWSEERGTNRLDGGSHFYNTYETADGKWISVGSIEQKFYVDLLERLGIDDPDYKNQLDRSKWPKFKEKFAAVFKTKTRDEWCEIMEGTDVCFAPVLTFEEAITHPQNVLREAFIEVEGVFQPAPAPRFGRTVAQIQCIAAQPGEHTKEALLDWGLNPDEIGALEAAEAI
jgi:alpha-methylacyl-CoA racemase